MRGLDPQAFPLEIQGHELLMKSHSLATAPIIFQAIDEDRERLREFLPWVDGTGAVQDTLEFIQLSHEKRASFELFDYGLYNTRNEYCGSFGIHNLKWEHRRCEFGFWLRKTAEGQGLIQKALDLVEPLCFQMGFHRLEIRCSARNQRSAKVAQRRGYTLDGRLREDSIELEVFRDTLIYSLLSTDKRSNPRGETK